MLKAPKYEPLRDYLQSQNAPIVTMSFAEIAKLVAGLPSSAFKLPAWWSNEDANATFHVQCKAWGEAGYKVEASLKSCTATFQRR